MPRRICRKTVGVKGRSAGPAGRRSRGALSPHATSDERGWRRPKLVWRAAEQQPRGAAVSSGNSVSSSSPPGSSSASSSTPGPAAGSDSTKSTPHPRRGAVSGELVAPMRAGRMVSFEPERVLPSPLCRLHKVGSRKPVGYGFVPLPYRYRNMRVVTGVSGRPNPNKTKAFCW